MINKHICVYDLGNYTWVAPALTKHFKMVSYFCEHEGSFPRSNVSWVGQNIEGVNYVDKFFDELDDFDIIFFPDCRNDDLQEHLVRMGKQVFGSKSGNELEIYRHDSNELHEELGLPKVKMDMVTGMDNLRDYLQDNENIYVKGMWRGDMETFHSENYDMVHPQLDALEAELGMLKDDYEFCCCHAIDGEDVVETGIDTFTIDGQFPKNVMMGIEVKDLGYFGTVKRLDVIPKYVSKTLEVFADKFEEYEYRNFYSNELRIGKDKKPYVTDHTCRLGSPPSELFFEMIENIGDIIDQGSQGILVEPKYKAKYGLQAIITSSWAEKHWQPIQIDPEVAEFVKVKNMTIIDGLTYYVPINDIEMEQIGSIVAYGNTPQEAHKKLKKYAEGVKGYGIKINVGSIDKAVEEVNKAKKIGIYF